MVKLSLHLASLKGSSSPLCTVDTSGHLLMEDVETQVVSGIQNSVPCCDAFPLSNSVQSLSGKISEENWNVLYSQISLCREWEIGCLFVGLVWFLFSETGFLSSHRSGCPKP